MIRMAVEPRVSKDPSRTRRRRPRAQQDGSAPQEQGIREQSLAVLDRLQTALRELIEATPGMTTRAADLQRTLEIPKKLAWQIHRLAYSDDPLSQAANFPGPAALGRLLDAATDRGVPPDRVAAVVEAAAAFERLIDDHAASRSEFDSILSGLSGEGAEQVDLMHRRAAFKAQSHLHGVSASTQLACFAVHPNPDHDDRLDGFSIRGLLDLRRLRSDATWMISRTRIIDDAGHVEAMKDRELLEPDDDASNQAGLLTRFCSQPLPQLQTHVSEGGYIDIEIEGNGVGSQSAVTCLNGDIWRRKIPRYRDAHNNMAQFLVQVRTACEVLVLDLVVHESVWGRLKPETFTVSDHRGVDAFPQHRERDRLPMRETAIYLGKGARSLRCDDVPRYEEMANFAFDRLGWNGNAFDVYRCRVEYPVMPSTVDLRFDLPEKPSA